MRDRTVFGNEKAEIDDLLYPCRVDAITCPSGRRIVTGRWGTGKTACVLLKFRNITSALKARNPHSDGLDWYIDESSLNADQLFEAFSGEKGHFQRDIERVWQAQIIGRAMQVLSQLCPEGTQFSGSHWDYVRRAAATVELKESLFNHLPRLLGAIAKMDREHVKAVGQAKDSLVDLLSRHPFDRVQECLRDIDTHNDAEGLIRPIVAVEPIDTPYSSLDRNPSVAQAVINALLNRFESTFQPSDAQLLDVYLIIPWHRYESMRINLPQRMFQYKHAVQWDAPRLRSFISKRIEWESERVKRPRRVRTGEDGWTVLFPSTVTNDHCNPNVVEDSFDYVIRHTHHRPRELQRLSRLIVEECARANGMDVDDVLRGSRQAGVNDGHIKTAATRYMEETTPEWLEEAERRFSDFKKVFYALGGIRVPFDYSDIKDVRRVGPDETTAHRAIDVLWETGVVGIEVAAKNPDDIQPLKAMLPARTYKHNRNVKGEEYHRWYYFEYTWQGTWSEAMERFSKDTRVTSRFVLHPRVFEALNAHVADAWPIGT